MHLQIEGQGKLRHQWHCLRQVHQEAQIVISLVLSHSLQPIVVRPQAPHSQTIETEINVLRVCKMCFSKRDHRQYPRGLVKERAFAVEVVAQTTSTCRLQLHPVRSFQTCQDKTGHLLEAIYLLDDRTAYRTHSKVRQMQPTSVEVDEELHGMMETVDPADIEAGHLRTEHLQHQYGHARRKQCMVEMEQETDPGLTTHNLKEICEGVDKRRRISVVELALRGETPVSMSYRGTREDLVETMGSIEIGE